MLLTAKFAMSTFIRSSTEKMALEEGRAKQLEPDTYKANRVLTKRGHLRPIFISERMARKVRKIMRQ